MQESWRNAWPNFRPDPNLSRPLSGDIILTGGSGKNAVHLAQTMARLKKPAFSHVALNLTGELCIHAMPKGGVTLVRPQHVIPDGATIAGFKAYRLRSITADQSATMKDELLSFCASPFHRPYNFLFRAKSFRMILTFTPRLSTVRGFDNMFCSELVARFYASQGVAVSRAPISATLPVDIESYLQTETELWEDVTELYRIYLVESEDSAELDLRPSIQRQQVLAAEATLKVRYQRDAHVSTRCYIDFHKNYRELRWAACFGIARQMAGPEAYASMRTCLLKIRRISRRSQSLEHGTLFRFRRTRLLRAAQHARKLLAASS